MTYLHRLPTLVKRLFSAKISKGVAFLPIGSNVHPVFRSHYLFLQDKTALPLRNKVLHVINRLPRRLEGRAYVAEVEGLHSVLHKHIRQAISYSNDDSMALIETMIRSGGLRGIVFQSWSAKGRNDGLMNSFIESHCYVATAVPPRIIPRIASSHSEEIRILLIGTNFVRKGFFLLPDIIESVRSVNSNIRFTLVCSELSDDLVVLKKIEGLNIYIKQRLSPRERDDFFLNHHFLLNLSVGDTLGTFLDSIEYNLPLIGFAGQHGKSYVKKDFGYLVESPIFEYDPDSTWTIHTFENVVLNLFLQGGFTSSIQEIVEIILELRLNESYDKMCSHQLEYAKNHLSIDKWLSDWNEIYTRVSSEF